MKHSENISKTTHIQHQKAEGSFFSEPEKGRSAMEAGKSAFWGSTGMNSFFPRAAVQAKLTIGQPGDRYEQEADAMGDQVVRKLAVGSSQLAAGGEAPAAGKEDNSIQRMCADCAKEKEQGIAPKLQTKSIFESNEEPVQRKGAKCEAEAAREEQSEQPGIQPKISPMLQTSRSEEGAASSDLESRLSSTKGGGSPLPEETRSSMESAFGTDFNGVRVHTNAGSVQMNQELGAQAFTHGSDIYFNSGKYSPGSTEGQRLLGHELTHVVQQGGNTIRRNGGGTLSQRLLASLNIYGPIHYQGIIADIQASSVSERQAALADSSIRSLINTRLGADYSVAVFSHLLQGSMYWRNPTGNDFFAHFVTSNGSSPLPPTATMNCWESIMYSAFLSGAINAQWIRSFYNNALSSGGNPNVIIWQQLGWNSSLPSYQNQPPTTGQLIFYTGPGASFPGHVALAIDNQYAISLWNQPNNHYFVQRIRITSLSGNIQVGNAPW